MLKAYSTGFTPFTELLIQWLEISQSADFSVEESLLKPREAKDLFSHCREVYKRYILAGLEHMERLPETWDYIARDHGPISFRSL